MAGVGKLLKQAQKMQKQMETIQTALAEKIFEISSGGGAVTVKIDGTGKFLSLNIDGEFLKEDKDLVEETLLTAIQEAASTSKQFNESEMQKITAGFNLPGMM